MTNLAQLPPDEFLLWWFAHASEHGLEEEYAIYYPRYFQGPDEIPYVWRHFRRRLNSIVALPLSGRRFLDVGCGLGTEVMWAALRGADALGIEMHPDILRVAAKRLTVLRGLHPVTCQVVRRNLLEVTGQFDVIFMREAFHHLEPRAQIVRHLAALLAPGGRIVIEDTNGWNPFLQFQFFRIRGFRTVVRKQPPGEVPFWFGNERITTPGNLNRLFAPYGIHGNAEYFRLLPTKLARYPRLARLAQSIEGALPETPVLKPFLLHYSWTAQRVLVR